MTDPRLRYCLYGVLGGVLVYGAVLGRLAGADFLNSYPFVRADGFDWFHQGTVVYEHVLGDCAPVLWFLRDPGFVLVCFLDAALGAGGRVVIFVHTLAFLVAGLVLLKAARWYAVPFVVALSVMAIYLIHPLNYVRLFVLADPLAVAFLAISTYAMLHHLRTHSVAALFVSGAFALAGALTQTYAAIPFVVGAAVSAVAHARSTRALFMVGSVFTGVAVGVVALKLAWRAAIPHEYVPISFGSLEPSLDMAPFYAKVWSFVYLPLLPFAATAMLTWWRRGRRFPAEVIFLAATVLLFAVLSLFYQWAEARFTFTYQAIVLLLLMALSSSTSTAEARPVPTRPQLASLGAFCSAVAVAGSVALTPMTYYGAPAFAWRPRSSWILEAWFAQPVDRFGLEQSGADNIYSQAKMPPFDAYPGRIVASYLNLRMRQHDRLSGTDSGCQADAAASGG